MDPKNKISIGVLAVILILMAFNTSHRTSMQIKAFEPYSQVISGSDQVIKMVAVKGGDFLMGNDNGPKNESPSHKVEVDDFWMGAYEITWDQYTLFSERRIDQVENLDRDGEVNLEVDAVASATTPYVDMSHGMGRKDFPVVNITQHAALTFCKWLSAKTGKFYRLPTEAEWEYACRAGSSTQYSFGDDVSKLDEYAWYSGNSGEKYQKIGQKEPNAFGLYDMHGNVAEWTMDQYEETAYSDRKGNTVKNPWIVPTELYPRSVRGGSWKDDAVSLTSSARIASKAAWKRIDPQIPKSKWWHTNASHVGFRIVRPFITPSQEEMEKYWLEAIDDY